jgi:toxin-antitoxin system PIN domain toxin
MSGHLCDANVWLALALSDHVHHQSAVTWLDTIEAPESVLFCRATQQALLQLLTNASVLAPYGVPPLSNSAAWGAYQAFASDERIALRGAEPAGLEQRWIGYALRRNAPPKLWMDAYLAAFAVLAGCALVTTETAFRQFKGLHAVVLGSQDSAPRRH